MSEIEKTREEIEKEIKRLDELIHKESISKCPKCGKSLKSYKAIEEHVKEFKHYGDYNATYMMPSDTGYSYIWYREYLSKLEGFNLGVELGKKEGNEEAKKEFLDFCKKNSDLDLISVTDIRNYLQQLKTDSPQSTKDEEVKE